MADEPTQPHVFKTNCKILEPLVDLHEDKSAAPFIPTHDMMWRIQIVLLKLWEVKSDGGDGKIDV